MRQELEGAPSTTCWLTWISPEECSHLGASLGSLRVERNKSRTKAKGFPKSSGLVFCPFFALFCSLRCNLRAKQRAPTQSERQTQRRRRENEFSHRAASTQSSATLSVLVSRAGPAKAAPPLTHSQLEPHNLGRPFSRLFQALLCAHSCRLAAMQHELHTAAKLRWL